MDGREVVRGLVGCPACQREYPIEQGVVHFGTAPHLASRRPPANVEAVQALLGLSSPGGNVVLVGSAVLIARDLGNRMEGVHFVGINAPSQVPGGAGLTLLECSTAIPLRGAMARGVVLGDEYSTSSWSAEAVRVLLPGLRLVVLKDQFQVDGVEGIVSGQGMWVGKKDSSGNRV
jgi:hypothetical protein